MFGPGFCDYLYIVGSENLALFPGNSLALVAAPAEYSTFGSYEAYVFRIQVSLDEGG